MTDDADAVPSALSTSVHELLLAIGGSGKDLNKADADFDRQDSLTGGLGLVGAASMASINSSTLHRGITGTELTTYNVPQCYYFAVLLCRVSQTQCYFHEQQRILTAKTGTKTASGK